MAAVYAAAMDKTTLRGRMKARGDVDPETAGLVVAALRQWMGGRLPGTVSAFLAMADEVDLRPLFEHLPGWRWVLPRVEDDGSLTFRDRDVPRERHPLGMQQPVDSGPRVALHEIDLILVPGLAFDRSGARLGRGAGYYDRVLADKRGDAIAVGVTTDSRVVDVVPTEPHDHHMDYLVTESGVMACSTRS